MEMTEEDAINLIRKGYESGRNRGDFDAVEDRLHPNFVAHDPSSSSPVVSRAAVTALLAGLRAAFPDLRREALDWVFNRDKIAVRWEVTGTHRGEFNGLAASGRPVRVTGITLYRLAEGKIVEEWVEMDKLGLLRQLGETQGEAA